MVLKVQKNYAEGFDNSPGLLSIVKQPEPEVFHTVSEAQYSELFFKD